MTIATTVSSVTDQGNGATTLFNYTFLIPDATEAVVTVTDTTVDPTTTTTIPASQYTITGIDNSAGGTVLYPLTGSPLAAGQYITIARVLPLIQTTQVSNQGNFYPEVVEAALDYQMMCIQQLSAQISAASFPDTFLGITGQTPITISQSGGQYVVSLEPITASFISTSAVTTTKIADGAATLAKLDRTGTSASVLTAQGAGNAPIWAALSTTSQTPPTRQTVLGGAVDSNGLPNFISIGTGLAVNIAATTVPIYLTAANGFAATGAVDRIGSISADTTISGLTASQTNYLYADIASNGGVTLGKTTLAPVYQFGGSYSTTNGQFTFNIQEMVAKVGNGSTAAQSYRVFIGEAVTNGTNVTTVRNYALLGRYVGPWTATLPAGGSKTSESHLLGIAPLLSNMRAECTSTDLGYAIGDQITIDKIWSYDGSVNGPLSIGVTPLVIWVTPAASTPYYANNATTGALAGSSMTRSKWKYRFEAGRGW